MEEFKWSDDLSVNNDAIDNHHKKLIGLFNEMALIIDDEQSAPLFSTIKVISELNIYALYHFKEEEALMEKGDYPNLEEHKLLHMDFLEKVHQFKEEYLNNDSLLNYEMINYLSDWILKHIVQEDFKYKEYL